MKKIRPALNSSSISVNNSLSGTHQVRQSSTSGFKNGRLSCLDRSPSQTPKKMAQVLDNDGKDVTPLPLYEAESGDKLSKPNRFLLDEIFSSIGSDHMKSASSSSIGSSQPSSLTTKGSPSMTTEDSGFRLDISMNPPAPSEAPREKDNVKQHMTEEMLNEEVYILLTETDTFSLLDIPPRFVSEDADNAEAIKERNIHYAELCKNRLGNTKYVERSMQTITEAPKEKQIQTDKLVMVDEGTNATRWDIYDSFCVRNEKDAVNTSKDQEKRIVESSSSTVGTGSSSSSLSELEMSGSSLSAEAKTQLIVLPESFQHSLLVMERSLVANIFQPNLAAYRQLPILEDPDSMVKPGLEGQSEEGETNSVSPCLESLFTFGCELTRGRSITSMAWNKQNLDLLAVGYGEVDSNDQKPGLICCWSLKNPTWPELVFQCHSSVTSLDFSDENTDQLAVGLYDGTVAIYSVKCRMNTGCLTSSSECSKKHLQPVWQVSWVKQKMGLSGGDSVENLVSVSADGRISKWFLFNNQLGCIDLMKLKSNEKSKKKAARKKTTEGALSSLTSGLCVSFHPEDSGIYLVGTWEGLIRKCSLSNREHFLDTYEKHFCPVNHVEWSPFNSDVFLSCSSDWTIQMWRQSDPSPVLTFTSTQNAVYAARWSPNWSTIFATINDQQLEIWDLNLSIVEPATVHHAAHGVKFTSLLFAKETDCVLVGDSDGQVTVHKIHNLRVGEGKEVDSLADIIHSAVSKKV